MKRAALAAGVSMFVFIGAGPATVAAAPAEWRYWTRGPAKYVKPDRDPAGLRAISGNRPDGNGKAQKSGKRESETPPVPKGTLQIIVSIGKQRATLFADGVQVAQAKISSGTPSHPTPMGIFSVLQKNRHHVSNLYDAKMPYMQRITWSGAALHEGPLPGYPASHGCVRLPTEFAQLVWKATKIGARVIISHDEAAPVSIEHDRLFVARAKPEPKPEQKPEPKSQPMSEPNLAPGLDLMSEPRSAPSSGESVAKRPAVVMIKTADATPSMRGAVVPDTAKPLVPVAAANSIAAEQSTKLAIDGDADELAMPPAPAATGAIRSAETVKTTEPKTAVEPPAKAQTPGGQTAGASDEPSVSAVTTAKAEAPRRKGPVSVLVSLKDSRLYVRQNMEPLFDAPVTVERRGEPIGTHVYTAMAPRTDGTGMRWTVVSIPSSYKQPPEPKTADKGRKQRSEIKPKAVDPIPAPMLSPTAALDRVVMPPDAVERIASLVTPGSSLIVTDNKLSSETGSTTDFIIETR